MFALSSTIVKQRTVYMCILSVCRPDSKGLIVHKESNPYLWFSYIYMLWTKIPHGHQNRLFVIVADPDPEIMNADTDTRVPVLMCHVFFLSPTAIYIH